jgi:hypothetical protein
MSDAKMGNIELMDIRAKEAHAATTKWAVEIVGIYAKSLKEIGLTIGPEDEKLIIRESMRAARVLAEGITKEIESKL